GAMLCGVYYYDEFARSSPLGPVYVRTGAKENFRRFHYRLRKRGMRVNAQGQVFGERCHLNGQHAFGNQFARSSAHDADSEYALVLRINNQLGHSLRTIKGDGAPGRSPGKLRDFDLT